MALFPAPEVPLATDYGTGQDAASWVQILARLGYAAKGIVFIVIGGLAVQAAIRPGERPDGSGGALAAILDGAFGRIALGVVAVGLSGYVVWRLVQALLDPEHRGTDAKGLALRAGYLLSAAIYAGIVLEAVRLLRGTGGPAGDGEDHQADHWAAVAMAQPMGRWILGLVGLGVIGFGLFELYRAYAGDLRRKLDLSSLEEDARRGVVRLGRFGLAARGVVFLIIGYFLVRAALHFEPREAQGLAGALRTLQEQAYGPYLLGIVALGLFAYGAYQLAMARYRVIRSP